ncbi:SDR family oxidoreductase [Microvirga sp. STR05]|uniref:SDR family oxidoreductase n=2 Tax=Hymenobacter TaxID=89966 RepID=A0A7G7W7F9_9BACT|nr:MULTISPECIES: SDR family oxidoreductase [Hymenobacter]MBD2713467.1 SDR family oxidoreductase [Hymenobacter duratus]MBR7948369.1 SDR family oxidoreductase [Microvirga sp. STR05]QNH62302.1 SDR family oxidoreductase [Hymenobacter sediminicola]
MTDLTDQVAIVTGASRGIGRATALLLAMQGAKVVCVARSADELEEVANKTQGLAIPADVSDPDDAQNVADEALRHFGRLDILVCNAGVGSFNLLEHFSATEWDRMFDVNVKGTFLMCKAVVPHFKAQRSGHIVGVASDVARRSFEHGTAYGASKFAQDAVLASLRKEVRPHGVKVSTIYPGLVDTYFNDSLPGSPDAEKTHLKPSDVAQAIRYVLEAPAHVVVDELMLHPLTQEW